jgi:hypothetical protein
VGILFCWWGCNGLCCDRSGNVSEIINADVLMIQEIAGYEDGAVMTPGESASAANGWVNTIDSNSPEVIANARDIIANNLYCIYLFSGWVSLGITCIFRLR